MPKIMPDLSRFLQKFQKKVEKMSEEEDHLQVLDD